MCSKQEASLKQLPVNSTCAMSWFETHCAFVFLTAFNVLHCTLPWRPCVPAQTLQEAAAAEVIAGRAATPYEVSRLTSAVPALLVLLRQAPATSAGTTIN